MRVLRSLTDQPDPRGAVVAIGVFDGVHKGHQTEINAVRAEAARRGLAATVVTFDPHPARVLAPARAPQMLQTLDQRLETFDLLGVDQVLVVPFTPDTALQSAESFVAAILVGDLGAKCVITGQDFRFGRDREGDVAFLRARGRERGFDVEGLPLAGDGERFSSTRIRALVQDGSVAHAAALLGRPYTLRGSVAHGDARGGAELGFPTANLEVATEVIVPAIGIYAGAAVLDDGTRWPAAISIGVRPQFYEDGHLLIEAHLVGFDGDLYETSVDLAFFERLRGEERYDSVEALVAQIGRDVARSQVIFEEFSVSDL